MAYQNFYSNLPGVRSSFRDGILNALSPVSSPNVVVLGTASKGGSYTVYGDNGTNLLTSEFGASPLIYHLNQIKTLIGDTGSVGAIKVGGKEGHLVISKKLASSYELEDVIVINCKRREDNYFEKVKLILLPFEANGLVRQRVIIVDENSNALFDSENILSQSTETFEVTINNDFGIQNILYTPKAFASSLADQNALTCQDLLDFQKFDSSVLESMPSFSSLLFNEIYTFTSNSKESTGGQINSLVYNSPLTKIAPSSSSNTSSYNQLYAAGELVSEKLNQFTSSIFVAPEWHANIMAADISTLNPTKSNALKYDDDSLGYMYKVMYQGQPYVFMFGRKTPLLSSNLPDVDEEYSCPIKSSENETFLKFVLKSEEQRSLGDLLNLVELHFHPGKGTNACKEVFFNYKGRIECHIDVMTALDADLPATLTIATPFFDIKLMQNTKLSTTKVSLPIKVRLSKVSGTSVLSEAISVSESSLVSDPFIQTPFDLTGAYIPEEVMQKLLTLPTVLTNPAIVSMNNNQVREVNLAHQAAQLAYKASSVYNATIAVVGLADHVRLAKKLTDWVGYAPTFEIDSNQTIRIKKNGSGVFGNKFLYGSTDYRDKSAYGGFILTTGYLLPDQEPYGIDDADEALDAGGYPIDLGKNLVIVGSSATVSVNLEGNQSSNNGISTQNSSLFQVTNQSLASIVAAKIFASAENKEPIGPYNGAIRNVTAIPSFTSAQLNTFAIGRICMVDALSSSISALRTSALPNSDFTRLSTIRVANRLLRNVREIGLKYIGNTFGPALQSLQNEIDGYLISEIRMGMVQGNPAPSAQVYASKLDQIAGKVNVRLRFTPPFALESIQVDIAVQPPASL